MATLTKILGRFTKIILIVFIQNKNKRIVRKIISVRVGAVRETEEVGKVQAGEVGAKTGIILELSKTEEAY